MNNILNSFLRPFNISEKGLLNNPLGFIERIKEKKYEDENLKFSTFLKKLRKAHHLTIAELSQDICSISYLSKLENGLITTGEDTIYMLFDRLGVDFDRFKEQNKKTDLWYLVSCYAEYKIEELKQAVDDINEMPLNILVPIIRSLYYLSINDLNNVKKEIEDLEPVKETLGKYESIVFLLIVGEYYIKSYNFNLAYRYLSLLPLIDVDDEYLMLLFIEQKVLTGYHLDNDIMLYHAFNEFFLINLPTYSKVRRLRISLLYDLSIVNEYPNKVLDHINKIKLSSFSDEEERIIYYYEHLIKIKLNKIKDVFDDLVNHKDYLNDGTIFGLFAYTVFLLDKEVYYHGLKEISDQYDFSKIDYVHQKFICFVLLYGSRSNDLDLLNFLKEEIITPNYKERYHIYDECYKMVYISLLGSFSRYKEAYLYLKEQLIFNKTNR